MAVDKEYWVCILTNAHHTVLYAGVTNDLRSRVSNHKNGQGSRFTRRYNIGKLVYYERFNDIRVAIDREKQIKGGSRQQKVELIGSLNPKWKDLFEEFVS